MNSQWAVDFQSFLAYIGPRPSHKHSLDRIENNGNYEPGNVRWATRKEQHANTRVKRIENFSEIEFRAETERRDDIEFSILWNKLTGLQPKII